MTSDCSATHKKTLRGCLCMTAFLFVWDWELLSHSYPISLCMPALISFGACHVKLRCQALDQECVYAALLPAVCLLIRQSSASFFSACRDFAAASVIEPMLDMHNGAQPPPPEQRARRVLVCLSHMSVLPQLSKSTRRCRYSPKNQARCKYSGRNWLLKCCSTHNLPCPATNLGSTLSQAGTSSSSSSSY